MTKLRTQVINFFIGHVGDVIIRWSPDDDFTDHVTIIITSWLVNEVLFTSLRTLT